MTYLEGGRPSASSRTRPTPRPMPVSSTKATSEAAGRGAAWSEAARTRLPRPLAVAVGALLCIGFGALMARSAGFVNSASKAQIRNDVGANELASQPAQLTAAAIPSHTPAAPPAGQPVAQPAAEQLVSAPARVTVRITNAALPPGWSCAAAIAYLDAHAAPGFSFVCPGYALGHQAMTCDNVPGVCSGLKVIVLAVPCPAAYENEAWNSRVLENLASGRLDPYGYCHR